jgi:hypothetical protein
MLDGFLKLPADLEPVRAALGLIASTVSPAREPARA